MRDAVDINKFDIHEETTANHLPSVLKPCKFDTAANQNVKVWVPILLKFENPYVGRDSAKFPLKIGAKFCPGSIEVTDWVSVDFGRVQSQSHEMTELQFLRCLRDNVSVSLCLARAAVGTGPTPAVQPMKLCDAFPCVSPANAKTPAMPPTLPQLVSINRYLVKKRRTGWSGFAALFSAGDSPPHPRQLLA